MGEDLRGIYNLRLAHAARERQMLHTCGGGGAYDKILLFLKFCQRIYKKWDFSGKKSLKNVKNRENQGKSLQKRLFCRLFFKIYKKKSAEAGFR